MMDVWQYIVDKKQSGHRVVILYVLESKGSSPGRRGFKMAVAGDGGFCGTIGGGIMEHKLVEMAKARLQQAAVETNVIRQVHDKSAGSHHSGMICSGEQTIFLYEVASKDIEPIKSIIQSVNHKQNATLRLTGTGIYFSDKVPAQLYFFDPEAKEQEFLYEEKLGPKHHLYVIGGGHCSLALSALMSRMGFYIRVYDERSGLNTMQSNEWADEKLQLDHYEKLKECIPDDQDGFVVIMTFGYRTDDIALRALMHKNFRYIGMLGSKNKIDKLFEEYRQSGIDQALLEKIHAPIGIQIKSQTTEEIAVSIAAEIIAEKNRHQ